MTSSLDHERQASHYIYYAEELVVRTALSVMGDPQRLSCFKEAISTLAKNFFEDPNHFTFSPEATKRYLKAKIWKQTDADEDFPNLTDFVDLLLGKNESFLFPKEVFNDQSCTLVTLTDDDTAKIQSLLLHGMKIKLESLIADIGNSDLNKTSQEELEVTQSFEKKTATKESCLELVSKNGLLVKRLSSFFKDDRDIALKAVANTWKALAHLPHRLLEDPEIALISLTQSQEAFSLLGDVFSSQRDLVLTLMEAGKNLESLSPKKPTHSIDHVASLLRTNLISWEDVPDELKSERAICYATIDGDFNNPSINPPNPENFPQEIIDEVLSWSLHYSEPEFSIEHFTPEAKDFNGLIASAVAHDGSQLSFASARIRAFELSIIFKALEQCPFAENYVLEPTKSYIQKTKRKIRENPEYYLTLDETYKDFYGFAQEAILKQPALLERVSTRLKNNKQLVLQAVTINPSVCVFASPRLQDDPDILFTVLKKNGLLLSKLPVRVKDLEVYVLTAVRENGLALKYASSRLQRHYIMVKNAVENNGLALQFADPFIEQSPHYRSILKKALKQNGLALAYANKQSQNDIEIVKLAINENKAAIWYASLNVRKQLAAPIRDVR